ncbi:hypothetical protein C8Q79DRAFT_497302 [Trametes meyenii]|nr:hypothetical protein C8Q79DRAFT_497302 [Trametes meyenii]
MAGGSDPCRRYRALSGQNIFLLSRGANYPTYDTSHLRLACLLPFSLHPISYGTIANGVILLFDGSNGPSGSADHLTNRSHCICILVPNGVSDMVLSTKLGQKSRAFGPMRDDIVPSLASQANCWFFRPIRTIIQNFYSFHLLANIVWPSQYHESPLNVIGDCTLPRRHRDSPILGRLKNAIRCARRATFPNTFSLVLPPGIDDGLGGL